MKKFFEKDGLLHLSFGGPDFPAILALIKSIDGRKFNPVKKTWTIPANDVNKTILENSGFNADKPWVEELTVDESYKDMEIQLYDFLRQYQKNALKYIRLHDNFGYLGAPMGSGKTVMSLAHIELNQYKKSLVICPAGVKINFRNDYRKFFNKELTILNGLQSVRHYEENGIYVINYELLSLSIESREITFKKRNGQTGTRKTFHPNDDLLQLLSSEFECIIADEAHKLKNEESQAFQAFSALAEKANSILLMSGTPILSRPSEIFGPMSKIKPKQFNHTNKYSYLNRYCGPKSITIRGGGRIMTYTGSSNLKELNVLLRRNGLLVIEKEELDYELPDVITHVVPVELDADYLTYKEELYEMIADNPNMALSAIEKLKQFSVQHKIENCIDYINSILEIEEKVVIFATHKNVVEFLHKKYKNSVIYNGDVSPANKEKNKQAFINDPKVRMIIGNTESMGIGVDGLQHSGSSSVIIVELAWNPAIHEQAIARLVRSGYQGKAHVNVHYLPGLGTIEEEIMELLDKKKGVFEAVIRGEDVKGSDLLTYMRDKFLAEAQAYKRRKNASNTR